MKLMQGGFKAQVFVQASEARRQNALVVGEPKALHPRRNLHPLEPNAWPRVEVLVPPAEKPAVKAVDPAHSAFKSNPDAWVLYTEDGSAKHSLTGGTRLWVGRWHEKVDLWLNDEGKLSKASRVHARLDFSEEKGFWSIADNGSANGTYVNGVKIPLETHVDLHAGDHVGFGSCAEDVAAEAKEKERETTRFHFVMRMKPRRKPTASELAAATTAAETAAVALPSVVPPSLPAPASPTPTSTATAAPAVAPVAAPAVLSPCPPVVAPASPPPPPPPPPAARNVEAAASPPTTKATPAMGKDAQAAYEAGERATLLSLLSALKAQMKASSSQLQAATAERDAARAAGVVDCRVLSAELSMTEERTCDAEAAVCQLQQAHAVAARAYEEARTALAETEVSRDAALRAAEAAQSEARRAQDAAAAAVMQQQQAAADEKAARAYAHSLGASAPLPAQSQPPTPPPPAEWIAARRALRAPPLQRPSSAPAPHICSNGLGALPEALPEASASTPGHLPAEQTRAAWAEATALAAAVPTVAATVSVAQAKAQAEGEGEGEAEAMPVPAASTSATPALSPLAAALGRPSVVAAVLTATDVEVQTPSDPSGKMVLLPDQIVLLPGSPGLTSPGSVFNLSSRLHELLPEGEESFDVSPAATPAQHVAASQSPTTPSVAPDTPIVPGTAPATAPGTGTEAPATSMPAIERQSSDAVRAVLEAAEAHAERLEAKLREATRRAQLAEERSKRAECDASRFEVLCSREAASAKAAAEEAAVAKAAAEQAAADLASTKSALADARAAARASAMAAAAASKQVELMEVEVAAMLAEMRAREDTHYAAMTAMATIVGQGETIDRDESHAAMAEPGTPTGREQLRATLNASTANQAEVIATARAAAVASELQKQEAEAAAWVAASAAREEAAATAARELAEAAAALESERSARRQSEAILSEHLEDARRRAAAAEAAAARREAELSQLRRELQSEPAAAAAVSSMVSSMSHSGMNAAGGSAAACYADFAAAAASYYADAAPEPVPLPCVPMDEVELPFSALRAWAMQPQPLAEPVKPATPLAPRHARRRNERLSVPALPPPSMVPGPMPGGQVMFTTTAAAAESNRELKLPPSRLGTPTSKGLLGRFTSLFRGRSPTKPDN